MVATPIGNLEDITLRALRILKEVDVILAEDTRVTKKLLQHYEITTPVERLDAHREAERADDIIAQIAEGKRYALVSDAGTPGISDPGSRLVARAQSVGVSVEAIPGPSSLTAALSVAGISADSFEFLGFLPHKKGRQTALKHIAEAGVCVLFESTHRIKKLMNELVVYAPGRKVTVAKELTKIHEAVMSGTPQDILAIFEAQPAKMKGEFVVILAE